MKSSLAIFGPPPGSMPRFQRLTVPDLASPPGYAHVVVATGTRLATTAGAVPLDEEGNPRRGWDVRAQARLTRTTSCGSWRRPGLVTGMSPRRRSTSPGPIRPISSPVGKRSSGHPSLQRPAPYLASRCSDTPDNWSRSRRSPSCPSAIRRDMSKGRITGQSHPYDRKARPSSWNGCGRAAWGVGRADRSDP